MFVELMSLKSFIFENMTPIEKVVVEPSDVEIVVKSHDEVPSKDLPVENPKKRVTEHTVIEKEEKENFLVVLFGGPIWCNPRILLTHQ